MRITVQTIESVTGLFDNCLACLRKQPAVHVPAELNRAVRDQFMPYIVNFFDFYHYASITDMSAVADLGVYMDNYEE